MPGATPPRCVMIIAGETSGDHHGAELVRAMKQKDPDLFFCGIGGEALRAEGVRILVDASQLSVVGITEVFSKLPSVLEGAGAIKKALTGLRPDLIILIDFPDFNLQIAKYARKRDVPVLYYISPQIWAWRAGRIRTIRKYVDHMAVILPFEADYYRARNVAATFVGHPLLDRYAARGEDPPQRPATDPPIVVGLLPGSRTGEISRNLPVMLAAASLLNNRFDGIRFLVSLAPSIDRQWVQNFVAPYQNTCDIRLEAGKVGDVLDRCRLAVAVSGTITLETAIHQVPLVIVYRVSPVSYQLGKALIRVDHIGLVNLIAGERLAPELIQSDATPGKIAQAAGDLLANPEEMERIRTKMRALREKLGGPGASQKTAEIALKLMESNKNKRIRF